MHQHISPLHSPETPIKPQFVPYCKIVKHTHIYNQKKIITDGNLIQGIVDGNILYNSLCPQNKYISWVEYSNKMTKNTAHNVMKRMNMLLKQNSRINVVILMRFYGPKSVFIPAGTSKKIAKIMQAINSKWGNMNRYSTKIIIIKILNAEPVPKHEPW